MKIQSFSRMFFLSLGIFTLPLSSYTQESLVGAEMATQGNDLETSVSINSFQTTKRDNKRSPHQLQYGDSKLEINQELTQSSNASSGVTIGLREVGFNYRGVHPANHLYGTLGLEGGYKTEDGWAWQGLARIEIPTTKTWNLVSDSRYIFGFEGGYAFNANWACFLGLGAETGMRATNVQPVLGVQYAMKDWVFHAVYPNPRIVYDGFKDFEISLNVDTFFTAVRAHRVHHHKKGVAVFKGAGADIRVDYDFTERFNGWISVGSLIGCKVTTGNKNFHKRTSHDIRGSMYGQIGISYTI